MGYTKTAAKGVSWISLLRVLTRIITIVRLSILGRILTPTQFGFFGIATLVLSFLEVLTETGINVFLVQEKRDIKEYLNAAWIISITRGILLAIVIYVSVPYIASFFKAEGSYETLALMALVPFIRGFINPAIITYQKDLLFHKEFSLRTALFFIDVIVSIIFALTTKSATSFVYGLIASALFEVLFSFWFISLWPKLQFEYVKVKRVITKGGWVTLTGIFLYFSDNGDNIAVGKFLGSASLGIYQLAYKFSTLPITEITSVINQVIFPVYTRFSEDKDRLWKAFVKVTAISSVTAIIFGCAIFLLAEPIIMIFMGEQWAAAIPAIKILSIYGILRAIFGNFPPLFLSVGKQNYVAQMTLCRTISLAAVIIPFVTMYGMVGAGYSMLFSMFCEMPPAIYFCYKIFKKK